MYKYKHVNGQVIDKPDVVVGNPYEYFEGPYVMAWWHINDKTGQIDQQWPKPQNPDGEQKNENR